MMRQLHYTTPSLDVVARHARYADGLNQVPVLVPPTWWWCKCSGLHCLSLDEELKPAAAGLLFSTFGGSGGLQPHTTTVTAHCRCAMFECCVGPLLLLACAGPTLWHSPVWDRFLCAARGPCGPCSRRACQALQGHPHLQAQHSSAALPDPRRDGTLPCTG